MSQKKDIPVVDEDRVKSIFSRLEKMDVQLDQDPLQYGPKRLNGKVATARGMASECERIYMSVSKDLQLLKSLHRQAELDFNLQMQYLLTTDAEVRSNRNIRDRDAAATMKLRDEKEAIDEMEVAIQDLVMVMSVVKAKRADLKDIQGRLRDQMKLCQEELGLGAHWGSKPAPGIKAPDLDAAPKTAKSALDQFNDLIIDEGETNVRAGDESLMAGSEDEAPEALPGEGESDTSDEEVDALLRAVDDNATGAVGTSFKDEDGDEDLDDVIGSLTDESSSTSAEASPEPKSESKSESKSEESAPSQNHGEDTKESEPVVDVFASSAEAKDPNADLGSLNSDSDVEAFFDNLASEPTPAGDEDIDLDELVGMLG